MPAIASQRIDAQDAPWPMRPWLMALIASIAGLLFWWAVDASDEGEGSRRYAALATFIAVATISFIMTVEVRRWTWSLGFALGWGAIIGLRRL